MAGGGGGVDSVFFSSSLLLISFGVVLLLTKNVSWLRQSVCNSSSRKKVFEEKVSDQNEGREPGGRGQREVGKEGGSG